MRSSPQPSAPCSHRERAPRRARRGWRTRAMRTPSRVCAGLARRGEVRARRSARALTAALHLAAQLGGGRIDVEPAVLGVEHHRACPRRCASTRGAGGHQRRECPRAAAMIATCEVGPPRAVQMPATRPRRARCSCEGSSSSAMQDRAASGSSRARRGASPREHAQHLALEVAQVRGALAHARVVERAERVGDVARVACAPREAPRSCRAACRSPRAARELRDRATSSTCAARIALLLALRPRRAGSPGARCTCASASLERARSSAASPRAALRRPRSRAASQLHRAPDREAAARDRRLRPARGSVAVAVRRPRRAPARRARVRASGRSASSAASAASRAHARAPRSRRRSARRAPSARPCCARCRCGRARRSPPPRRRAAAPRRRSAAGRACRPWSNGTRKRAPQLFGARPRRAPCASAASTSIRKSPARDRAARDARARSCRPRRAATGVTRLFARRATRSRSKRSSGSPARTRCARARRAARSLRPPAPRCRCRRACRTSMPPRGAQRHRVLRVLHRQRPRRRRARARTPPVGSIATPSPAMPSANTGSGTSASGRHQPASGAQRDHERHGVASRALEQPHRVDHPHAVERAAARSAGTGRGGPRAASMRRARQRGHARASAPRARAAGARAPRRRSRRARTSSSPSARRAASGSGSSSRPRRSGS